MNRVEDTPLYDRTKVNTTDVLLRRVHRNYRERVCLHTILQTCLEWKPFSFLFCVGSRVRNIL